MPAQFQVVPPTRAFGIILRLVLQLGNVASAGLACGSREVGELPGHADLQASGQFIFEVGILRTPIVLLLISVL
jgi:hypothetical protein